MASMERKQSKFIYDYLPYNTFNHAKNQLSGRVMRLWPEQDEEGDVDLDLPKSYVISRIRRHIGNWPNADDLDLQYAGTEIVKPGGASYHVYPRHFECNDCGSVTEFDRDDIEAMTDESSARDAAVCGWCDAALSDRDQLPFVAICECGAIAELHVPEHCGAGMRFLRPTTSMDSWGWACVNPNCDEYRSFYATPTYCPNGDCDNRNMEVSNHTASSAFYPQVKHLVNVQSDLDNLHSSDRYQVRIVSDYLLGADAEPELSDREKSRITTALLQADDVSDLQNNDDIREAASGRDELDELASLDDFDEAYDKAADLLTTDRDEHRTETERWLSANYDADLTDLCEELYEYLSITNAEYHPTGGIESTTYHGMVENDAADTHLSLSKVEHYNNLRDALNLAEVRLIKNFPITTVTYGYTRTAPNPPGHNRQPIEDDAEIAESDGDDEDEDARDVELNLFDTGEYANYQLFAQDLSAEAVMVSLDKDLVLEWLAANDIISDPTVADPDRWFLRHVITPGRYDPLPDHGVTDSREAISRHCYALLHTLSHAFVNSMGALAGHQKESLVERLMPHTMSFIVYKRPDTDFTLGSLFTLFEEQFDGFTTHLEDTDDCSIDPICYRDENGACEDCLYQAAITCENANHNLGRATYFGGQFDGQDITGYKDI